MAEEVGNPCAFKSVCHITHNTTDETCGHHLVKTTEDCPLNKFAIRIQTNFAEKVKEAVRHKAFYPKEIIHIIDQALQQDGGD